MTKHIFITGVSSGIGYSCLKYFIEKGYHVFGSVRKTKDAERLTAAFGTDYTPLMFDVTDRAAIAKGVETVKSKLAEGENLFALVSNAGIHIAGPAVYLSTDDLRFQVNVNVFGALNVIQAFLPFLEKTSTNAPGRILHVGSTSARISLPFSIMYAGTKSAMHSICDTLRRELMIYEIDVIDVYVGPVNNEMVDKVAANRSRYAGTEYEYAVNTRLDNAMEKNIPKGLSGLEIATFLLDKLEKKNPKPRYALNKDWFNTWGLPINLPHRVLDFAVARQLKLFPKYLNKVNFLTRKW